MIIGILSLSYLVGDAAARRTMGAHDRARLLAGGPCSTTRPPSPAFCSWRISLLLRESRVQAAATPRRAPIRSICFASGEARVPGLGAASRAAARQPRIHSRLPRCRSAAPSFARLSTSGRRCTCGITSATRRRGRRHQRGVSRRGRGIGAASGWLSDRLGANGRALILFLGFAATAAALLVLMALRPGAASPLLSAARDRNHRVLPARPLFLPRRGIRAGFRRQASLGGLLGHHRRRRLLGCGGGRRQRRADLGGVRLAGRLRGARRRSAPWRRSAPGICTS